MEDREITTPGGTLVAAEEVKKLIDDREKARQYIRSCKETMGKQSEQHKKEQSEFKQTLANLESQQYNTRFNAVAIKLELETHKIFKIFTKRASLLLAQAFYLYRQNVRSLKKSNQFYIAVELKFGLKKLIWNVKKHRGIVGRKYWNRWVKLVSDDSEKLQKEILKVEKENKEFKFKITKRKMKGESGSVLNEIMEENKQLKEKIKASEESVGVFIREMSLLLDQHEPPGFREEIEKFAQRSKRQTKPVPKARLRHSPEHGERRLQFD
ncbi:unnamed protein product [Blepharisma stoltei]|uniref:Uncharacterized protein n=1 Tax=Blepharisma stoltei TaxID=1481888 RepID=A0AAU9JLN1_9CILI|nr:unnamed protein product [Blepharisma stoltei]